MSIQKRLYESRIQGLDENQRFGGKVNIPASKETTEYIQNVKGSEILINVPSALHPSARFLVIKNPNASTKQDKVLMTITSDPKRRPMKMFSFFGTHVSHQKAMDFAKHHKLVAMKDKDGNPLYAKESVELDEAGDPRIAKMSRKAQEVLAMMANSLDTTGGPYLDKNNVKFLTRRGVEDTLKAAQRVPKGNKEAHKDIALVKKELGL